MIGRVDREGTGDRLRENATSRSITLKAICFPHFSEARMAIGKIRPKHVPHCEWGTQPCWFRVAPRFVITQVIGRTVDDAAGEAFDKVAKQCLASGTQAAPEN